MGKKIKNKESTLGTRILNHIKFSLMVTIFKTFSWWWSYIVPLTDSVFYLFVCLFTHSGGYLIEEMKKKSRERENHEQLLLWKLISKVHDLQIKIGIELLYLNQILRKRRKKKRKKKWSERKQRKEEKRTISWEIATGTFTQIKTKIISRINCENKWDWLR